MFYIVSKFQMTLPNPGNSLNPWVRLNSGQEPLLYGIIDLCYFRNISTRFASCFDLPAYVASAEFGSKASSCQAVRRNPPFHIEIRRFESKIDDAMLICQITLNLYMM